MKKEIKHLMCLMLLLCFSFVSSVPVFASETSETPSPEENQTENTIITDSDKLEQMIDNESLEVPEGYTLEKVEISVYDFDSTEEDEEEKVEENTAEPLGIKYKVKNVVNKGDGYYYADDYDSDWFYGPATVSETYSRTKKVKKSVSVSVSNSVLTTGVGYDVSKSYTNTKKFNTSVASGKKLNVKVYTNYQKKTFDIYNKTTGKCVDDDAYTMKPVGLIIKQYTYSAK